jgi:hypothetical protein
VAIEGFRSGGSTRLLLIAIAAALLATASAQAQTVVSGTVTDGVTDTGIASARVNLLRENGALIRTVYTDADGVFTFQLSSGGRHRLSADRAGYLRAVSPVFEVKADHETTVVLRLVVDAILLAPLEIVARSSASRNPTLSGFYARMQRGLIGHFLTREDIAQRGASHVADLVATAPGVRVQRARRGGGWMIYMGRALPSAGGCPAQIFIDGLLMNRRIANVQWDPAGNPVSVEQREDVDFSLDEVVSPAILEGIEVYNGVAGVPAEFLNADSRCGVVLIWTRRGLR